MRRYLVPGALLCLGSFLLFMSLLLPLVVAPRLSRVPLDRYAVLESRGTGSYLSRAQGDLITSQALQTTTTVRGDVEAGSDDVAVWDMFSTTEDLTPGVSDAARVLATDQERVALDRRTGRAVACCDEAPPHVGLTFAFPFDTRPIEYELWDTTLDAARPASFVRADRLGGMDVLVFAQRIEPTAIDSEEAGVAGTVVYAADKELWVEPRTGTVVRVLTDQRRTLQTPGADPLPISALQLAWDERTVADQTAHARAQAARLRRYALVYPLSALIAGPLVLGAGIVLTGRAQRRVATEPRRRRAPEPEGVSSLGARAARSRRSAELPARAARSGLRGRRGP